MLRLAVFRHTDLATVPSFLQYFFPLASRPWLRRDVEEREKTDKLPFLNANGHVDFAPGDPEDPRNWSRVRCWYICAVAIFLVLHGTISSGMTSGSAEAIAAHFSVSKAAANLTTTLFVLGYCAGPFLFAPLSEFYGRRWLVYTTFTVYLAFTLLCAFAPNFGALLVGRFLAGMFVSAPICAVPGIVADLWGAMVRDNIMVLYAFAIWGGPSLGTVVAALLADAKDWRWPFYFVLVLGVPAVFGMITLPETLAITILKEKARRHRQANPVAGRGAWKTEEESNGVSIWDIYKTAIFRPWALLFDTISFLCAVYLGIVFLLQFMLFSIYPIVFHQIRGWSSATAQLPLLGAVAGAGFGAIIVLFDTQRRTRISDKRGYLMPEDHLFMAKIGGIGFPLCMFWFAWTGQYDSIHWMVPTLGGTFLSTSLMLVFVAFVNYIVQCYGQYSASIVAVNTFARSLGSASAPLFTMAMFKALKVGGGGSLIAGVAALLAICPFVFSRYGASIRARTRYASSDDFKQQHKDPGGEEHPTSYGQVGEEP